VRFVSQINISSSGTGKLTFWNTKTWVRQDYFLGFKWDNAEREGKVITLIDLLPPACERSLLGLRPYPIVLGKWFIN
jgi:hypothetical protein